MMKVAQINDHIITSLVALQKLTKLHKMTAATKHCCRQYMSTSRACPVAATGSFLVILTCANNQTAVEDLTLLCNICLCRVVPTSEQNVVFLLPLKL